MKQSFYIVFVQVLNLLFGFYITIAVASSISPAQYSIFALYQIITTFVAAFSFMGYEVYISRNLLYWRKIGCHKKIINNISKAICSRFLVWLILIIPVSFYIYMVTNGKYGEQEKILIYSFLLSGLFNSILQSSILVLQAFNKYLEAIFINVVGMLLVKVFALYIFNSIGFLSYLFALVVGVFFLMIISLYRLWEYIDFRSFKLKTLFVFRGRKDFIFSAYMQYLTNYSDRLFFSMFLTAELLGSYNLAKQIQEIGKLFIEGFFDPLVQKIIYYKKSKKDLFFYFRYLRRIHFFVAFLGVVCVGVLLFNQYAIIEFLSLNKYPYFNFYFVFSLMSSLFYLFYKVQINLNSLFLSSRRLVNYNALALTVSIISSLMFALIGAQEYLYANRLIIEFFFFLMNCYLFREFKNENRINSVL